MMVSFIRLSSSLFALLKREVILMTSPGLFPRVTQSPLQNTKWYKIVAVHQFGEMQSTLSSTLMT